MEILACCLHPYQWDGAGELFPTKRIEESFDGIGLLNLLPASLLEPIGANVTLGD